ncbi:sorbitol dehydrogenase [Tetranychus urticae]|uniref:Sorbitol dehydrogenase n=1 Tax=Tetranychus urticae TaxID=32264 RepID=T1KXD1_TETUR|nr:sorbitol dehydrogenase [Tetranychus urticae]XP_015791346.1 sorbitol dehydrogenase [Tetranychus urticae]
MSPKKSKAGGDANKAIILHKAKDLRLENTSMPSPPGPDEVQLRGEYCGICGTDVHLWQEAKLGIFEVQKPLILGHEASATVIAVGQNVTNLTVGDPVVIENAVPCCRCKFCLQGTYNYCEACTVQAKGLPPADGLIQQYYNHPAAFTHKIPPTLRLDVAALAEPLAVSVHACNRAKVTFGQKILVCGAGTMGLLTFLTAKAYGASRIAILDIMQSKLDKAIELGVDGVILSRKGMTAKDLSDMAITSLGGHPDITMECTGSEICVNTAVEATQCGGKIILIGLNPNKLSLSMSKASLKELDLLGVCRYRNSYPQAVELLSSRPEFEKFITHTFQLDQAMDAFESMQKGEGLKIVIKCN